MIQGKYNRIYQNILRPREKNSKHYTHTFMWVKTLNFIIFFPKHTLLAKICTITLIRDMVSQRYAQHLDSADYHYKRQLKAFKHRIRS